MPRRPSKALVGAVLAYPVMLDQLHKGGVLKSRTYILDAVAALDGASIAAATAATVGAGNHSCSSDGRESEGEGSGKMHVDDMSSFVKTLKRGF
jgi:hypothetical protein